MSYQVLVDADFLAESMRCKMDIVRRLEDTLHGQVKPCTFPPFAPGPPFGVGIRDLGDDYTRRFLF